MSSVRSRPGYWVLISKNVPFLSLLISFLALFFSLTPPLGQWYPDHSLDAKVGRDVMLDNVLGIVEPVLHILLTNTGNRSKEIERVELVLLSPSGKEKILQGLYTVDDYNMNAPIPLLFPIDKIRLSPGETYSNMLRFTAGRSPSCLKELQSVSLRISRDISKQQLTIAPGASKMFFEASPESAQPAIDLFHKNLDLETGDYFLTIRFFGPSDKLIVEKHLRMPVYDFHIELIESQSEDFKLGMGVYQAPSPLKRLRVESTSDDQVKK